MISDRSDGPIDARVHAPYKIELLVRTARDEGITAGALLAGTELRLADLANAKTRTSTYQFALACRNALKLGASPALPFRMGARIRLSSYGLYGYAMLTSATVRDAFRLSVRYHGLTTPTWRMNMYETETEAVWTFQDRLDLEVGDPLYRFLYEFQLSAHRSLARDLWDEAPPKTLSLARYRRPPHAKLYDEWLGHRVEFNQAENEARFPASGLDAPMPMHHPLTAVMVREMCERLLEETCTAPHGLARQVYALLAAQPGRFRDMSDLSRVLSISARTLRRRLQGEGTSYQRVLDDVRCNLAKHYLQDTHMTGDDIAKALGFSDSANFRHAFRKWWGASPSEYRRKFKRVRVGIV